MDLVSFWPSTTTGNPAVDAATRLPSNELFVFTGGCKRTLLPRTIVVEYEGPGAGRDDVNGQFIRGSAVKDGW